jgi:pimeloyl-ACP methyl ester carboxylesterase
LRFLLRQFRYLVALVGLAVAAPIGWIALLALFTPITPSGLGYLIGGCIAAVGLIAAPILRRAWPVVVALGVIAIAVVAGSRLSTGGQGSTVRLVTLPGGGETRLLDRLIHERDLSLFGSRTAAFIGFGLSRREHEGLVPALTSAYASLAEVGGTTSSPTFNCYSLQQHPDLFDAVLIEPPAGTVPRAAVIYLHGFTGNFTVQGWLIGQAAREVGLLTVCPSVDFRGLWWTPRGEQTVRRTLDYLASRGIRRVYLAGLSNGAIGACRLAPRLRWALAGLILISGADASAPDANLPVLSLHGRDDERMPVDSALRYIRQAGDRGTSQVFDGDHLLLAKKAAEVQAALAAWLRKQEAAIE